LTKNQQFILGRNLYQASGNAFSATNFFESLGKNLSKFSSAAENHVLNGILFEVYFNSRGDFRMSNIKMNSFEEVMRLRANPTFSKSFAFIRTVLTPYKDSIGWWPDDSNNVIDVDVIATEEVGSDFLEDNIKQQVISSVRVHLDDITSRIKGYGGSGLDSNGLKQAVANYLHAPKELVNINSGIPLYYIKFAKNIPPDWEDSDF
jgi:hypothetical protein